MLQTYIECATTLSDSGVPLVYSGSILLIGNEKRRDNCMCNPKVMSRCQPMHDATSLHHCLQNHG